MRRKKIKWAFQSAIFRVIFLTIILIVPINLATLYMSSRAITKVENQISADIKNALELNMNQVDYLFKTINRRLYNLSIEDEDYIWLLTKQAKTKEEFSREMQAIIRLQITTKSIQNNYQWIDNVFVYFPEKNYFLYNTAFEGSLGKKAVLELIHYGDASDFGNWIVLDGDKTILARVVKHRNSYYGAWIDLDHLLSEISLDNSENITVFTSEDGKIISNNKDLDNIIINPEADTIKYNNEKYITVSVKSDNGNLIITELVSRKYLQKDLPGYIRAMRYIVLLALLLIPILIYAFVKWMVRPVTNLVDGMAAIEDGNLDYRINEEISSREFRIINKNFNEMMDKVVELKINVYEKELEKQNIRMQFLSQQIQPHFILNVMNIIYSYEPEEYDLIQKMILSLAKYFQFVVNANKSYVKIKHEIAHIDNYLEIQKIRYGERIDYEIKLDAEAKEALIPPLIVQNIVENIIKYALRDDEKNLVDLIVKKEEEAVKILILDNGYGINDKALNKINKFIETGIMQEGMGIGIQNTIERLDIFFRGKAKFYIDRRESGKGTVVEITIPFTRESGE